MSFGPKGFPSISAKNLLASSCSRFDTVTAKPVQQRNSSSCGSGGASGASNCAASQEDAEGDTELAMQAALMCIWGGCQSGKVLESKEAAAE